MSEIETDIKAIEELLRQSPGQPFDDYDSDEMLEHLRAVRDWGRAFASVATPDRISRLLAALKEAQADALEQAKIAGMGGERELALMAKFDRAVGLLRGAREEFAGLPHSLGYDFTHLPAIDAFLQEQGK